MLVYLRDGSAQTRVKETMSSGEGEGIGRGVAGEEGVGAREGCGRGEGDFGHTALKKESVV